MRWFRGDQRERRRRRADRANARGLRAMAAGRLSVALREFARAVELSPSCLEARVNLGSACYRAALAGCEPRAELLAEAARHCRYVLGLDPHHGAALLNLAATQDALGEFAEALALLETLARARPRQRDVQYNLAVAYAHEGRLTEAIEAARRELDEHPDHPLAGELLACLLAATAETGEG